MGYSLVTRRPHTLRGDGVLQAHSARSGSSVVPRHPGCDWRAEFRLGVVEFSRAVRRAGHRAGGHEVRRVERAQAGPPTAHVVATENQGLTIPPQLPARREGVVVMKRALYFSLCILLLSALVFPQTTNHVGFRALQVDAGKVIGQIRSFQGVNGPPTPVMARLPTLIQQYKQLRIDQVRTHDFMGPTEIDSKFVLGNGALTWLIPDNAQRAGVVKTGNASIIFPDWNADPEKPQSYNFGPTDKVIADIRASGAEVYYRIGRSWGANINPPADFDKFAAVVKHIAMHYNHGWAGG